MKPQISLHLGSLTDGDEDVLVNASNTNADLGSGVSGAIRRACGEAKRKIHGALLRTFGGPMEPGQVMITNAGEHPRARFVAHVAVMDYRRPWDADTRPDLARIDRACAALWSAIESIGEPALSLAMVALGGCSA